MRLFDVVLTEAVFGALDGVGIFFEPKEPYKWQILCAATLKGVLVALLTGSSLAPTARWWSAMATGALYGLLFGLVIYLAKGGPKSSLCEMKAHDSGRIDSSSHRRNRLQRTPLNTIENGSLVMTLPHRCYDFDLPFKVDLPMK